MTVALPQRHLLTRRSSKGRWPSLLIPLLTLLAERVAISWNSPALERRTPKGKRSHPPSWSETALATDKCRIAPLRNISGDWMNKKRSSWAMLMTLMADSQRTSQAKSSITGTPRARRPRGIGSCRSIEMTTSGKFTPLWGKRGRKTTQLSEAISSQCKESCMKITGKSWRDPKVSEIVEVAALASAQICWKRMGISTRDPTEHQMNRVSIQHLWTICQWVIHQIQSTARPTITQPPS